MAAAFVAALLVSACTRENDDPNSPIYGGFGTIEGKVYDSEGTPLPGVAVTSGASQGFTAADGSYELTDAPAGERVSVSFDYDGYFSTHKVIEVRNGATSVVDASMKAPTEKTFNSASGVIVNFEGATVEIPASSLVDENGDPFSGTATIKAAYYDPTSDKYLEAFPGDFFGISENGSETMIESFGFINAEIVSGDAKLNLAPGSKAEITLPVPSEILSRAPSQIPLWWYDEAAGYWKEEGAATLNGSAYKGEVEHFTSWNCDRPRETSYIEGRVVDKEGQGLPGAQVVTRGKDYVGGSQVIAGERGRFRIPAMSDAVCKLQATHRGLFSEIMEIETLPAGQTLDIGEVVVGTGNQQNDVWTALNLGVQEGIIAMDFIDQYNGWVMTTRELLKTTDGGAVWTSEIDFGNNDSTYNGKIQASASGYVYCNAGKMLYKSIDNGANWIDINPRPGNLLTGMHFANDMVGYASNYNGLHKTTDAGQSWTTLISDGKGYSNLFFVDANVGFMSVGRGGLQRTVDGGSTWEEVPQIYYVNDYSFPDDQNGWVVGYEQSNFKTTNAGETWTQFDPGLSGATSVCFVDENVGYVGSYGGEIRKTTDGGDTWYDLETTLLIGIWDIDFVDEYIGWIGMNNGILLRTTTGGE